MEGVWKGPFHFPMSVGALKRSIPLNEVWWGVKRSIPLYHEWWEYEEFHHTADSKEGFDKRGIAGVSGPW